MKRLENILMGCLLAVTLLNGFWDGFPALPVMYVLFTMFSVLSGIDCLRSGDNAPGWVGRNAPAAMRRKWSRVIGALFLVNAAIWPAGMLVERFVKFDTDFLLLAQMIGFPLITILGVIPLRGAEKPYRRT